MGVLVMEEYRYCEALYCGYSTIYLYGLPFKNTINKIKNNHIVHNRCVANDRLMGGTPPRRIRAT